jgi:hypothetical protein
VFDLAVFRKGLYESLYQASFRAWRFIVSKGYQQHEERHWKTSPHETLTHIEGHLADSASRGTRMQSLSRDFDFGRESTSRSLAQHRGFDASKFDRRRVKRERSLPNRAM